MVGEIKENLCFTSKRIIHFLTSIKVVIAASLVFNWVASL